MNSHVYCGHCGKEHDSWRKVENCKEKSQRGVKNENLKTKD